MKLRIKFKKYGPVRFIGHLDVMRFFQKANRRAELDVAYTGGFSPHQIMSFAAPLGVGLTSNGEYMDLEVHSLISCEDVKARLNAASVPGIEITSVKILPDKAGNAMASVAAAGYTVAFREGRGSHFELVSAVERFLAKEEILITKETKKGSREINLKEGIYEMKVVENDRLYLLVDASSAGNIKPIQVVEALFAENGETLPENALLVNREETYLRSDAGELLPLDAIGFDSEEAYKAASRRCRMSRSLTGGRPAREKEVNEIRKTMDCSEGKLIFTGLRERKVALLVNAKGVAAVRVLKSDTSRIGGIYLGKIQNVAKNIDACFVEIAPGELCFLPLREATAAHLTNRQPDGNLKAGDELVVMVTRDAQKTKRASVTANPSRMEQQLAKSGSTPENASEALQSLLEQSAHKVCPACLHAPSEAIYEVLEQLAIPSEYSEVLTDDAEIFRKLSESSHPLLQQKSLRLYDDPAISLRLLYSLERGMDEALDTKVWLKCGGYLVIEPTEAMTVIDVNSGKNESKHPGEETYYQVNAEAAEEVARQLRLRNLSGIIIVDFINMTEKENRQKLLEYLKALTASDPQHPRIVDMTPLGLVEITRKKSHPTLAEQWKNL